MDGAQYPDLRDVVVFVSGGATGIGADIVRAFHAQRAIVAFCDTAVQDGRALVEDLGEGQPQDVTQAATANAAGGRVHFFECDVTDTGSLGNVIDTAAGLGPLGVLVNNAANDTRVRMDDVDPEAFRRGIDVNLTHQFFATQRAARHMRPRKTGSIINLGSIAPDLMVENLPVYATSKAASHGLTRAVARDLGADGIRINTVQPGAILTARQRRLWYPHQADVDALVDRQCLKRELNGADVAAMVLFLASSASAACTAQTFVVDAGMS